MTDKQQRIIDAMKIDGAMTPLLIGVMCGIPREKASAWASSGLRELVANGLVEKAYGRKYRIKKIER